MSASNPQNGIQCQTSIGSTSPMPANKSNQSLSPGQTSNSVNQAITISITSNSSCPSPQTANTPNNLMIPSNSSAYGGFGKKKNSSINYHNHSK